MEDTIKRYLRARRKYEKEQKKGHESFGNERIDGESEIGKKHFEWGNKESET